MATQENGATARADTSTPSSASRKTVLRHDAPQIRTAEAIIKKHEEILDGLEQGTITGKISEQMTQQLKAIRDMAGLELRYWQQLMKFGRRAPAPRSPILRNMIGLPEHPADTDRSAMAALTGEVVDTETH